VRNNANSGNTKCVVPGYEWGNTLCTAQSFESKEGTMNTNKIMSARAQGKCTMQRKVAQSYQLHRWRIQENSQN